MIFARFGSARYLDLIRHGYETISYGAGLHTVILAKRTPFFRRAK
jgi:hypothetical protein